MLVSMGWEGESLKTKNRVIKGKIRELCKAQVTVSDMRGSSRLPWSTRGPSSVP